MSNLPRAARALAVLLVVITSFVAACDAGLPTPDSFQGDGTSGARRPAKKAPPKPEEGNGGEDPAPSGGGAPPSAPGPEAPSLTAVVPDSVTLGASPGGVELTLTGSRFVAGSKIDLAGALLDATLTSPSELKANVPASALAVAGVLRVSVTVPGAGESNPLTFTVANPTSVSIASLSPTKATVGAASVSLIVTGAGFVPTSKVRFNGAPLTTTFESAAKLSATIPGSALVDAGRFSVNVSSANDIVSLPAQFDVESPAPVLASIAPASAEAGSAATVVTVEGSGFTRGSEVLTGTTPLATTFVSGARLRATIPASLLATAGALALRVRTGAPGGGTSAARTFTVTGAAAACTYTCAEYGYGAGECYEGWACNGATGCLYEKDCNAGAGGASCAYRCEDYGYAPGQCYAGWYCLPDGQYAGCLGQTTCQ